MPLERGTCLLNKIGVALHCRIANADHLRVDQGSALLPIPVLLYVNGPWSSKQWL